MNVETLHHPNNVTKSGDIEGRAQATGLLGIFRRHPVASALVLVATDAAIVVAVRLAAPAILPPIPRLPDFIALCAVTIAMIIPVTFLGWWRVVGCNRPAEWRNLKLLALPALLVFLPLLGGFKVIDAGTIVFLLAGYLLTASLRKHSFGG